MIKAMIFDLDGTLADTMDDLRTAMNEMLRSFGYKERSREDLLRFINQGARSFIKDSLPDDIDKSDELIEKCLPVYLECYSKCYDHQTYAYEGLKETLQKLYDSGIKLGVLSNKNDIYVKAIIKKLFGDELFVSAEGFLDLPHKPDPASALRMADRMNVDPSECAFIGDSDTDMKTAANAGMLPVGVSWGYRSADVLKESGATVIVNKAGDILKLVYN